MSLSKWIRALQSDCVHDLQIENVKEKRMKRRRIYLFGLWVQALVQARQDTIMRQQIEFAMDRANSAIAILSGMRAPAVNALHSHAMFFP